MLSGINWLDILFAVLLIGMVYKGSRTGVGGQLVSLAGWLILVFFAITYYDVASRAIFGFLLQKWARPISFLGITIIIFTATKTAERILNIITPHEEMPPIERVGGAIVACLRACLFFGIIGMLLIITPLEYTRESVFEKSKTARTFVDIDAAIYSWLSEYIGFVEKVDKEKLIENMMATSERKR